MNCIYHPERPAVTSCQGCKNPICEDCLRRVDGVDYCHGCASLREAKAPAEKKGLPLWVKGCGVGCGVVTVLFLICIAVIIAYLPKIKEGVGKFIIKGQVELIRQQRDKIIDALDEGIEKEKVYSMFDEFEGMVERGEVPFVEFAEVMDECEGVLRDGAVDEDEVKHIEEAIEELKLLREAEEVLRDYEEVLRDR